MARRNGSGVVQRVMVFGRSEPRTGNILVAMARTGFVDVTVNGQRFYYDERQTYNNFTKVNIPNIMKAQENKGRRGIIILSRRK